ncbi:hypothetical protein Q8A73_000243 [Channa argus]|nr:hypothetical protein Q8A73_000243 [Channa argus]
MYMCRLLEDNSNKSLGDIVVVDGSDGLRLLMIDAECSAVEWKSYRKDWKWTGRRGGGGNKTWDGGQTLCTLLTIGPRDPHVGRTSYDVHIVPPPSMTTERRIQLPCKVFFSEQDGDAAARVSRFITRASRSRPGQEVLLPESVGPLPSMSSRSRVKRFG